MNPLKSVWDRVAGTKNQEWYAPKSVSGGFVDELVKELTNQGYHFAYSGQGSRRINGTKHEGRHAVYVREKGPSIFGYHPLFEEVDVFTSTRNAKKPNVVGQSVGYAVSHANGVGMPRLSFTSVPKEWQHVGATTDVYTTKRLPTVTYNSGQSASQVLGKVGVGLEAKVN